MTIGAGRSFHGSGRSHFQLRIMYRAMCAAMRSGAKRGAAAICGWLAGVWIQQHIQPKDRLLIIFTFTADIADPGGEMRHSDQFVAKPCEVCQQARPHDARVAFIACVGLGRAVFGFAHFNCLLNGSHQLWMLKHIPKWRRPIDQNRLAHDLVEGQKSPIF